MSNEEQNGIAAAIVKAREEGMFQGKIITLLEGITKSISDVTSKHTAFEAKLEMKVSQKDHDEVVKQVSFLQKIVWMGLGAIGIIQIVIGFAK